MLGCNILTYVMGLFVVGKMPVAHDLTHEEIHVGDIPKTKKSKTN